ncbi:hypothetical protein [Lactobacillus sp. LL6]|uniref:hypothetical protein n=1 Tax=Lactobacillus sp. LL6 TaxID=2596827 RepID=UPI001185E793|nr:hypothetical protein [Lactobacillus sp. LL6]TSO26087.1 hypothetical protein FOD82_03160 [Lactobacillus sp. LL6]
MSKQKGFLIAESLIGLTIAILGVIVMAITLSGMHKTERVLELKTDRAYAWHVMKENNLKEVMVHDRIYKMTGNNHVYDSQEKEVYKIEK